MFDPGTLVKLSQNKTHSIGEDSTTLSRGTCGMVLNTRTSAADDNHLYTIEFGSYGQWYCYHNELELVDPMDAVVESEIPYVQPDNNGWALTLDTPSDEEKKKEEVTIDFEKDLERRVKELDAKKGNEKWVV